MDWNEVYWAAAFLIIGAAVLGKRTERSLLGFFAILLLSIAAWALLGAGCMVVWEHYAR